MDANIAINWLNNSEMVANSKKIQLMFLVRNNYIKKKMSFVGKAIKSFSTVELQILKVILKIFSAKQITK